MGSMDDHCFWCGTWVEGIYIPDFIMEPLCGDCIRWACNRVDNPKCLPPQPDRRTITCDYLKRLFFQKRYSRHVIWRNVAECLCHWLEPGRSSAIRIVALRIAHSRSGSGRGGGGGGGHTRSTPVVTVVVVVVAVVYHVVP